jgi:hypothetical protein
MNQANLTQSTANAEVAAFLRAIAGTNERIQGLAHSLHSTEGVRTVDSEFDCYGSDRHVAEYPRSPAGVLDWSVEAEFQDGTSLCWCLSVRYEEPQWLVEAEMTTPGKDGPTTLVEIARRNSPTVSACAVAVGEVAEQVAASVALRLDSGPLAQSDQNDSH